ncbi:hypothetical protein F8M41_022839 [Gigaspora margarita]|uniref:Uncharacterized protein n=1 Tax=Gigaspora margarita TaxID=4874 RepID=A0A8H4EHS2_GIGMA|nr:hypothetical protein F8M41_022839 [Gigaspora margarita]
MAVEYEVNGKKYYGLTDYAIIESKSGNLICITEDKIDKSMQKGFAQNIRQLKSTHDINKKSENGMEMRILIIFTVSLLPVLSIIVGLLVDKAVDIEPEAKRVKVNQF